MTPKTKEERVEEIENQSRADPGNWTDELKEEYTELLEELEEE
jgi:hypothetical protein